MEQLFEAFHNAVIIDKMASNTCKKVEKREGKDGGGEGGSREGGFSWEMESLRQMARGAGRIIPPIMKTPQSWKLQV